MKSLLLILSLIIFTGSTITAQEYVYFGAKGGVNLSNMRSDSFADNDIQTGFHLGLLAEIPLGNGFSLQPEILYSTQGTKAKEKTIEGPWPVEIELEYLQVPVLAKIFLTESLAIEAGPSINFLVNEKRDGKEADYGKNFEFGGALGASYIIRGGFFGSARYTYGFTDAYDFQSVKNNGFQLGVGLLF